MGDTRYRMDGRGESPRSRCRIHPGVVIVFVLILLCTVGMVAFWRRSRQSNVSDMQFRVCLTGSCNYTAQRFLDNMNPGVQACENFYQFACGGFINRTILPSGKRTTSVTDELEDKVHEELRFLLKNMSTEVEFLDKPYSDLVTLYSLCTNGNNNSGVFEARRVFQEAGGWPLLNYTLPDNWTFQETERNFQKLFLPGGSLLHISLMLDFFNVGFEVMKPKLLLPGDVVAKGTSDPQVTPYLSYMTDLAVMYGGDKAEADTVMKQVLEFEIALSAILESRKHNEFITNYTLDELNNMPSMNWISWTPLFKSLLPESFTFHGNETVLIHDYEYVIQLNEFLKGKQNTLLANYMFWRAAERLAALASEELRKKQEEFRGTTQPIWRRCLKIVSSKMGPALSSLYTTNFFDKNFKLQATKMAESIRQQMVENLDQTAGIDEQSKRSTSDQVKGVVTRIAFPDELLDMEKMKNYYKDLKMDNNTLLRTFLDVTKWNRDLKVNQTLQGTKPTEWSRFGDITAPAATFNAKENTAVVTAGLLQPPLFDSTLPLYVNYGSIGYLLAHHFTQIVDDTSDDNAADNNITYKGGLRLAYKTYRKSVEKLEFPEAVLPGLQQYSQDQLFMLSLANMMCTKYSKTEELKHSKTPVEIKVNGIMKNSPEFNKTFQC